MRKKKKTTRTALIRSCRLLSLARLSWSTFFISLLSKKKSPHRRLTKNKKMSVSFALAPPANEVQESGGVPVPLLATVPAPAGSTRLHFTWGLGNRISLCPLVASSSSSSSSTAFSDGVDVDGDVMHHHQQHQHPRGAPSSSSPPSSEPPAASVVQWCVVFEIQNERKERTSAWKKCVFFLFFFLVD